LESISSAVSKQKQYIPILNELIIRVNTETLAGAEEYDETPMIMERVSKSLLPLHYFTIKWTKDLKENNDGLRTSYDLHVT
jgi:hypothetical protein